MVVVSAEDIKEEFADLDLDIEDEKVLLKLQEFCEQYSIGANKISCEYFSFNSKSKTSWGVAPTIDSLLQFEHDKLKHLRASRKPLDPIEGVDNLPDCADIGTPTRLVTAASKRNITPDTHSNKRFVTALGSPSVASSQSVNSSQPTCKYADRKNKGEIVLSHNKDDGVDWTPSPGPPQVSLENGDLTKPYKFMFESMRERAAVLDEAICRMGDLLTASLEPGELMDTRLTQVEQQLAVGRICCDSEGHLNSNSVLLQGSMDTCGGQTIPLDLSRLESYSLFPGQIVGVNCTNPNGSKLLANKLHLEAPPAPPPAVARDQVIELLVACGPFTPSDSTNHQPLLDILECIRETKPHVAILIGPFVDIRNKSVEQSDEFYQQIFDRMLKEVYDVVEGLRTQVVLVPALRDAHENPVYPQPPYNMGDAALWNNKLRSVSDPAILKINDVSVGVTSSDILFHLGKEEISYPSRSGDRLSRLCGHLLSQRSFYPLYPPSLEQNLDYEHQEQHGLLLQSPHILLLPSDLVYFARDLETCTVVNPGRLTKGAGPGTYSRIFVKSENAKMSVKADIFRI